MSFDIILNCEKCPISLYEANYTYNVSGMWFDVYPEAAGMMFIDGMTGKEAYDKLVTARAHIERNFEKYEIKYPENGWGGYNRFLHYINKLIVACIAHPDNIWSKERGIEKSNE